MTTPEGWYDDGSGSLRWWDGQQWTAHVRAATPPAPPASAASAASTAETAASAPVTPASTPSVSEAPATAAPVSAPTEAVAAPPQTEALPSAEAPAQPEPAPFVPPYAIPSASVPLAADPTLGAPPYPSAAMPHGAAPWPTATAPAPRRSVLGIVGLALAVVGVVLACVPPIAIAGWALIGAALVVSLVSLFLRGAKWPGIVGIGVSVVGSVLAVAVSLVLGGLGSIVEAGAPPATSTTEEAEEEPSVDPSTIEGVEMVTFEELEVGDCLPFVEYGEEEQVYELPVIACDQPHTDEVYFIYEIEDGEFPGDDVLTEATWDRCLTEFETFVGIDWKSSELDFYNYQPTKASWNRAGDREVQCIAYSYDDVTGTLRGAAR